MEIERIIYQPLSQSLITHKECKSIINSLFVPPSSWYYPSNCKTLDGSNTVIDLKARLEHVTGMNSFQSRAS
jgi:hypothetical protein